MQKRRYQEYATMGNYNYSSHYISYFEYEEDPL